MKYGFNVSKDKQACLAIKTLYSTSKTKSNLLSFSKKLADAFKHTLCFDSVLKTIPIESVNLKSLKIITSCFLNVFIAIVNFYNHMNLPDEFINDIGSLLAFLNEYFRRELTSTNVGLRRYIEFYNRLLQRNNSGNFNELCKHLV
jgi:hypothetical protein